jgi:hypothetical protein
MLIVKFGTLRGRMGPTCSSRYRGKKSHTGSPQLHSALLKEALPECHGYFIIKLSIASLHWHFIISHAFEYMPITPQQPQAAEAAQAALMKIF